MKTAGQTEREKTREAKKDKKKSKKPKKKKGGKKKKDKKVGKYPFCNVPSKHWIGNGWCDNYPPYNTPQCGWDGGDCPVKYPDCNLVIDFTFGDGYCDKKYNTLECGFDGGDCEVSCSTPDGLCNPEFNNEFCKFDAGDCLEFNAKYPYCNVSKPYWVGDGICDDGLYNTTECGFDGGDCEEKEKCDMPNGLCDAEFNNEFCNFDAGDCWEFNAKYPYCNVSKPYWVGDGICDDGLYNTFECGFDGGDCGIKCAYPNGLCDAEFNNEFCKFDMGDCLEFNAKYPHCNVSIPYWVGDNICDVGLYNTTECGFDGGDCIMNHTGNSTSYYYYYRRTLGSMSRQNIFERVLNYFFPEKEEEKLEWQK